MDQWSDLVAVKALAKAFVETPDGNSGQFACSDNSADTCGHHHTGVSELLIAWNVLGKRGIEPCGLIALVKSICLSLPSQVFSFNGIGQGLVGDSG